MKKVYLDNAATTQVDKKVLKKMNPYFSDNFGNASSLHSFGLKANKALQAAREIIAQKINAKTHEIIFTSGATEADNLALRGIAYANGQKGDHIITSKIEHPAVRESCHFLEQQGFKIDYLPVDNKGFVSTKKLTKLLNHKTILVSLMFANNEIGAIQPIEEIGKIINGWNRRNKNRIYFHTDAVQAFTKVKIDVQKFKLDLLSLSSHKIYGPKGVGALYVKEGTKIERILHGGHHEYNLRPGTENVAGIVGFAEAANTFNPSNYKKTQVLRDYLIKKVLKEIPNVKLNGPKDDHTLPNIVNFTFKGAEGEALMLLLDKEGIAVSTGSACASKSLEPSYVLQAIGRKPEEAHGSIRISLGKDTTKEDINYTLQVLKKAVKKLRSINPLK